MHDVYSSHKLLCKIGLSSQPLFPIFVQLLSKVISVIGEQLVSPADASVSPGYSEANVNILIFKILSCHETFILACVH